MKKIIPLMISLLFAGPLLAQEITGSWMGTLQAGATKLRFVIHIQKNEKGYTASFDSPDQKAFGLMAGKTELVGDSLFCSMELLRGGYRAFWDKQDQLTGTLTQGPVMMPLNMKRLSASEIPQQKTKIRAQTPKEPLGYVSEDVEYDNADQTVHFGATLTKPAGASHFPTVILISGSGTQDRDGTMFDHKTYQVLADLLTKQGIAVLRVDDRGIGKTSVGKADPTLLTSLDFAADVNTSIQYLLSRKDIDPEKIGLIGHSEGGMIAPMVAVHNKAVSYMVLLAGPGQKGEDIWDFQMNRNIIKPTVNAQEKILAELLVKKMNEPFTIATDLATVQQLMLSNYADWKKTVSDEQEKSMFLANPKESFLKVSAQFKNGLHWLNYFLNYQPATNLSKINIPVLALNGEMDIQVSATENLHAIDQALTTAGNKDYTIKLLPGLNHLFQTTPSKETAYASIDETFSPVAAGLIGTWILDHSKKK